MRRASDGSHASYREPSLWMFRLSRTTLIVPASGYASSTSHLICSAKPTAGASLGDLDAPEITRFSDLCVKGGHEMDHVGGSTA